MYNICVSEFLTHDFQVRQSNHLFCLCKREGKSFSSRNAVFFRTICRLNISYGKEWKQIFLVNTTPSPLQLHSVLISHLETHPQPRMRKPTRQSLSCCSRLNKHIQTEHFIALLKPDQTILFSFPSARRQQGTVYCFFPSARRRPDKFIAILMHSLMRTVWFQNCGLSTLTGFISVRNTTPLNSILI